MFRLLLKFSAAVSVAIFAMLLLAVARARWVADCFTWNGKSYSVGVVCMRSGFLVTCHPPYEGGASPAPIRVFSHERIPPDDAEGGERDDIFLYDHEFDDEFNLGLGYWAGIYYRGCTQKGWRQSTHHAIVPYWLGLGATPLLPIFAAWLGIRRGRRARLRLCAHCGYDLRATPNLCPECGQPAQKSKKDHRS